MVRFFDPLPSQPRIQEKRRGTRLNSRVPIVLEWKDAAGKDLREDTFTRVVGPYGFMVVFPQQLDKDQRLNVVNTATDQSNEARVAWNGKRVEEGWEVGIELTRPPTDFWGLEL